MLRATLVAAGLALSLAGSAGAQSAEGSVYAVVHVDIAPPIPPGSPPAVADKLRSDANALAHTLILEWAGACKTEPGCLSIDVLLQRNSFNHYTLIERFKNERSQADFESLPAIRSLRDRFQPVLGGPLDQRFSAKIN